MGFNYNLIAYVEISEEDAQRIMDHIGDFEKQPINEYRKSSGYEEINYCSYTGKWLWKDHGQWCFGTAILSLKDSEAFTVAEFNNIVLETTYVLSDAGIFKDFLPVSRLFFKYASCLGLFVE